MNPIQDILIALHSLQNKIGMIIPNEEERDDGFLITINEQKIILYPHIKQVRKYVSLIATTLGHDFYINIYPNSEELRLTSDKWGFTIPLEIFKNLQEESKKDDLELVLTHGRELLDIIQYSDLFVEDIDKVKSILEQYQIDEN